MLPGWALDAVLDFFVDECRSALAALGQVSRSLRGALAEFVVRGVPDGSAPRIVDIFSEPSLFTLGKTQRLRCLRVEHANLKGSLEPLAHARFLEKVSLAGCDLVQSTLQPLQHLTRLVFLNLYGCGRLKGDLKPLSGLASLKTLILAWCHGLKGDVVDLRPLLGLKCLDLDWCAGIQGNVAHALAAAPLMRLSVYRASRLVGIHDFRVAHPRCLVDGV